MPPHVCAVCGKEFDKKASLTTHGKRKIPCKAPVQLIQANINQVLETAGLAHLEVPTAEFRDVSKRFNNSLTKETRMAQGIFFTPKKARDILFTRLKTLSITPKRILEPAFGSGEFLLDAKRLYPDARIVGVEKNEELYKSVNCPDAELTCCDFLEWKGAADLIIGNPPYFNIETGAMSAKEKKALTKQYAGSTKGRANIYVLFLYKCLTEHLEDDGYLAFIIPTSLYNCSYYQPMRNYIQANTTIRFLETLHKPGFYETGEETMLIVLQKRKLNDDFIFKPKNGQIYLSPFYKELTTLTRGAATLSDLGLGVKTGNVVWNQVKEHLADTGKLLIYSSNINNCELKLNNLNGTKRKQYLNGLDKPAIDGPVILVERGYGHSFSFNCVLVDLKNFYAENHINVIYPTAPSGAANLQRVITSFRDERSQKFVKWFLGNGMLSASDLASIVPIFE